MNPEEKTLGGHFSKLDSSIPWRYFRLIRRSWPTSSRVFPIRSRFAFQASPALIPVILPPALPQEVEGFRRLTAQSRLGAVRPDVPERVRDRKSVVWGK